MAAQRYVLSGATGLAVSTVEELEALLVSGERVKRKAATKMNARSSRAHALFIMTLEQRDLESDKRVKSQLFLAGELETKIMKGRKEGRKEGRTHAYRAHVRAPLFYPLPRGPYQ